MRAACHPLAWLCLVVALEGVVGAQTEHPLTWKWTAGDRLRLEVHQNLRQQLESKQTEAEIATEARFEWLLVVNEVSPGGEALLMQRLERVQITTQLPALGQVQYDSQSPPPAQGLARQLAQYYKPLVGQEIRQRITARGEIVEVMIPESLSAAGGLLGQWYAGSGGEPSGRFALAAFPAEALQPGQSWESVQSVNGPSVAAQLQTNYRYTGRVTRDGRPAEEFQLQATLKLMPPEPPSPSSTTIGQQTSQGKLWFDQTAGRLIAGQMEQQLTVESQYQGQELSQTIDNLTEVKLSPLPPEPAADQGDPAE